MKRLMLLLLALPALAQAQTPTSVSLAQAQQYAVEHSFAVRGSRSTPALPLALPLVPVFSILK